MVIPNPVHPFIDEIHVPHRGFKAYANANQLINNATWTVVNLDAEVFDDKNEFDTVSHSAVIKETGRYLCVFQIVFMDMTDGADVEVAVREFPISGVMYAFLMQRAGGGGYMAIAGAGIVEFTAGDTICLAVYQNSGGNRTLRGTVEYYNFLSVIRIK